MVFFSLVIDVLKNIISEVFVINEFEWVLAIWQFVLNSYFEIEQFKT